MPIVRDRGWKSTARAVRAAAAGADAFVLVGIQGNKAAQQKEGTDEPITLVEVAAFNEFGLGVPERSFLRGTFDLMQHQLERLSERLGERVASGQMDTRQALNIVGHALVNAIKDRISAGIEPPNAQSTIDRKGSSIPLIDHGQLRSSITHVVKGG